ncbi:hypothetical protein [Novosphingobium sp. P6W]|uniref:hypothetical protein n=1 Tax=Novosphingobium sp. P6W TaxID=1609758 RepID=UPI0005C31903|nr:hypothetical protein [Novosphingobium sp. P6W]AXB77157.1 hypothetical protein TQ38_012190 [Novosphingobium sp. P6W]KIS30890.1 hypothetical protein TQ38_19995 [Novosphingobium sp. P6W]
MTETSHRLPFRRALAVAALALLAAACIFAPGKFTSQIDLKKDRSFAFRYTGEILMIPLMKSEKDEAFEPSSCHDEESLEERTCSGDELAQQKTDWEESRAEKKKSDAQAAKMLLGGIDPSNPESGKELADKLRRQAGWNKVEYLGDGKFDVDFAISGKLDHDFIFPTFEGFPMSNPFIQVFARQDGTVRIDAPGFGPQSGSGAMAGMMAGMAQDTTGSDGPTSLADGSFAVFTNGEVLANNTDEGAASASGGKLLSWKVNPRTAAAPTALVKLSR